MSKMSLSHVTRNVPKLEKRLYSVTYGMGVQSKLIFEKFAPKNSKSNVQTFKKTIESIDS